MTNVLPISGFQGDVLSLRVTGYISGSAADLTSYGLSGEARASYGGTGSAVVKLSPVAVAGQESDGVFDINVHPTGMSNIPVGLYFYDVQRYTGQADVRKILRGKFYVYPEGTQV